MFFVTDPGAPGMDDPGLYSGMYDEEEYYTYYRNFSKHKLHEEGKLTCTQYPNVLSPATAASVPAAITRGYTPVSPTISHTVPQAVGPWEAVVDFLIPIPLRLPLKMASLVILRMGDTLGIR